VLLGRWDVAHVAADEAYRLALETRQSGWVAIARLGQANLAALRGSAAKALELVVDVERTALLTGSTALLNGVAMTRGMAELGQDRPDAAFHHFRRMMDPADPAYHPVERLWQIDYLADAAAGSGHVDEARQVLAGMEPVVAAMPSPGMRRAVAYARAVLADDDMVEQRIAEALSLSVPLSPWYRARVHLAHGLWLRRQRRVAESRESLRAAHEVFSALGAQAWITRARRELQATGVNVQDVTGPGWARLTAQELQIAQLAAAGLSNRDIAQRLYLSHRTVGSHLYRLYPKLGVTSRGQLHAKLPVPQN
jgi:DNA-binding CsgD family transcriptional regulator